jgi:hypothetical protein
MQRIGRRNRRAGLVLAAGTVVSVLALSSAASANLSSGSTTCTGTLAGGTYQKVIVPADATCVTSGVVTIRGGLFIEAGATFIMGSEGGGAFGTISGGVHGANAASVQIHGTAINGGLDLQGGSGPGGGANFDAIELDQINGGATVAGYDGVWFGFIGNSVNGVVNLNDNVSPPPFTDPDSNEYVTNTIHGNLDCSGNSPAAQIGDSGGSPNTVTGHKTGQCAGL